MRNHFHHPGLRHAAVLLFLAVGFRSMAQEAGKAERPIRNTTVFAEVWGEGIFNSLNIEKTMAISRLVSVHTRLGFGYWRLDADFFSVPVDVGLSYGQGAKLELSVGATPFAFSATRDLMVSSTIAPTIGLHLRIQDPHGGVFLRIGALVAPMEGLNKVPGNTDHVEKGTWAWNPGLGLGFTF
jgi:hypothetical protein